MATQTISQTTEITPHIRLLAQKFIQNYLPLTPCVRHHTETLRTLWGSAKNERGIAKMLMQASFGYASLNDGNRNALDSTLFRLEKVERWTNYREWGGCENSLLHTLRDIFFIPYLANIEEEYGRRINREILMQAFLLHDWGEIASGDTLWKHKEKAKTEASELEYFKQIVARIVACSEDRQDWLKAYLLQYAYSPEEKIAALPLEHGDRELILRLKKAYPIEAQIFNAAERLGYLRYAIDCYARARYFPALIQVLRNQQRGLSYLAEPGRLYSFRNHLFTRRIQRQAQQLITACDGLYTEV